MSDTRQLKQMLLSRQRELLNELHGKIRNVRDEGAQQDRGRLNPGDTSDVEIQDDLEFVLIQMKAETANKISEALARLEEGTYGLCFECGERDRRAAVARAAVRGSAARTAKKPSRWHSSEIGRGRAGLHPPSGFEMRD